MEREKNIFGNTDDPAGFGFNREAVVGDNQHQSEVSLIPKLHFAERAALGLLAVILLFAIVNQAHAQGETPFENTPTTTEPCPENLSDYTLIPVLDGGYLNQTEDSMTWVRSSNRTLRLPENASSREVANAAEGEPVCQNTIVRNSDNFHIWAESNSSWEPTLEEGTVADLTNGGEVKAYRLVGGEGESGFVYLPELNAMAPEYNPWLAVTDQIPNMPYMWGVATGRSCLIDPELSQLFRGTLGGNLFISGEQTYNGVDMNTLIDPLRGRCEKVPSVAYSDGTTGLDWDRLAEAAFEGCPNLPEDFKVNYPKIGAGDGTATATNEEGTEFVFVPYNGDRCDFKNGSTR